ncbi:MAG: amino acid ABC transporter substrate-binding protein [Quinella sp. 3Q1]|nr:amino acid ABC transporter substrate-binding protein [Quinella sp. 3Q1]
MKKIFLPFLLMIFIVTGCGGEEKSEEVKSTRYSGKINVGIDEDFAPMTFRDESGELVGFDIDLAKEVADRMGAKFEFKPIDWDKKEDEIKSGNVDMIWSGCDITDKNKDYMVFSKPYMDNRQVLMVKKNSDLNINSEYDLEGKIVGTQAGTTSEHYVNDNEDLKSSFAAFKTYSNFKEGFAALKRGNVEVLIVDEIAARYEMTKHPDAFKIFEVTVGSFTEFGIGFSKDRVELHDRIQRIFYDMIKDGTARKISEQWFGADLIKSHW